MSNVPFAIYTASGNELSGGLSEVDAMGAAQRAANERGESVDVCQGSRLVATVEPERATVRLEEGDTAKKKKKNPKRAAPRKKKHRAKRKAKHRRRPGQQSSHQGSHAAQQTAAVHSSADDHGHE